TIVPSAERTGAAMRPLIPSPSWPEVLTLAMSVIPAIAPPGAIESHAAAAAASAVPRRSGKKLRSPRAMDVPPHVRLGAGRRGGRGVAPVDHVCRERIGGVL